MPGKDRNFVIALLSARLVDPAVIMARLLTVEDRHRTAADRAASWLNVLQEYARAISASLECRGGGVERFLLSRAPLRSAGPPRPEGADPQGGIA